MLDPALERGQGLVPEVVEVLAQRFEGIGIEGVDAARPVGPIHDQPGVLQHAEVLRDRRPADGEITRQLADGSRPVDQAREDPAAGRIAERVELRVMVSVHLR